jgi:FtsZ-interacting cell division protein ZipA
MDMSVVIPIALAALVVIGLLVWKNRRDEKKIIEQMNEDYPKSKDEEGDTEIEEVMK